MVFEFFDGLGGMALLAAFWGVWDIFSGLLLTTYWGRRTKHETTSIITN